MQPSTSAQENTGVGPEAEHALWLADRTAMVAGPHGNLALIDYEPVGEEPEHLANLAASAEVDLAAEGIRLTLDEGVEVTVDGVPASGQVFLARLRPDGAPLLAHGTLTVDAFSLDGTDYELRVYDSQARTLIDFDRIEAYPYDPAMVIEGRFKAFEETGQVPWDFTRSSDSGHAKKVPGVVAVRVGDVDYELLAFLDGAHLVLVYSDGTTGAESYAPGRFLRMPCPDPGPGGECPVTVDFNRTCVPPCGFSNFYSCPIPPPQNRIAVPVRAGEQRVRWHGDGAGH